MSTSQSSGGGTRRMDLAPIVTSINTGGGPSLSPQMPTPLLGNWCDMTPYGFEGATPTIVGVNPAVVGSDRPSAAQSPLSTRSITRQTTSAFQAYVDDAPGGSADGDTSGISHSSMQRVQTPQHAVVPSPSQLQQTATPQPSPLQQMRKGEFSQLLVITGASQQGNSTQPLQPQAESGGGLTIPPIVTPMMPTPLLGNWCDLTPTLLSQVSAFAKSIADDESNSAQRQLTAEQQQQQQQVQAASGAAPPMAMQQPVVMGNGGMMMPPYMMPYMMPQPLMYPHPYAGAVAGMPYPMMYAPFAPQPMPWGPPFAPPMVHHHHHHHHQAAMMQQFAAPQYPFPSATSANALPQQPPQGGLLPPPGPSAATSTSGNLPFRFPPPPPPGHEVCKTFLRTNSTCDKYYAIVLRWYAKVAKSIPSSVYPNAPPCPAREAFLYDFDAWVAQMCLWWNLNFGGDKCTGRHNPPSSGRAPPGSISLSNSAAGSGGYGATSQQQPPPPYSGDGQYGPPSFRGGWQQS